MGLISMMEMTDKRVSELEDRQNKREKKDWKKKKQTNRTEPMDLWDNI